MHDLQTRDYRIKSNEQVELSCWKTAQVAEYFGVTQQTVLNWIHQHKIFGYALDVDKNGLPIHYIVPLKEIEKIDAEGRVLLTTPELRKYVVRVLFKLHGERKSL